MGEKLKKGEFKSVHRDVLKQYGLEANRLTGLMQYTYEKGEYISREAQPLPYIFIVFCGKAKVFCDMENGRRFLVSFYESGGIIGDVEIMMQSNGASASVQALSEFTCIAIPAVRENIRYLKENTVFLNIVAENLAHKLERSTKNSAHIILYPLEERLCSYIDTVSVDGIFSEKLTEVAEVIGTSYRHLLRELNRLAESGILEKQGKTYRILAEEELKLRSRDFYRPVEK